MKKITEVISYHKHIACPYIFLLGILVILIFPSIKVQAAKYEFLYPFYLFMFSFLISFLLIPIVIRLGLAYNCVDVPDAERKLHKNPTPLTGGIAIYFGFLITLIINFHFSVEMKAIMLASSIIFITGLLDDRFGLSARIRLLIQCASALIVIMYNVRVTFVPPELGGFYTEIVITLIWLLGITNSMNFIDGMDGIASGSCIVYAIFFALVAYITNQSYMMFIALALGGSCLGFFPYNFRTKSNALIFLGDNGSTFLGFLIASLALLGEWGHSVIDIAVPILILSALIFDMVLTTFLRIYRKEVRNFKQWIDYTGRDHFHYQLSSIGLHKVLSIFLYLSVSVCFGLAALVILFSNVIISVVVLLHSALAFFIIGVILVFGNNEH